MIEEQQKQTALELFDSLVGYDGAAAPDAYLDYKEKKGAVTPLLDEARGQSKHYLGDELSEWYICYVVMMVTRYAEAASQDEGYRVRCELIE